MIGLTDWVGRLPNPEELWVNLGRNGYAAVGGRLGRPGATGICNPVPAERRLKEIINQLPSKPAEAARVDFA